MASLKIVPMVAALVLFTASLGGCPLAVGLLGGPEQPADLRPADSADAGADEATATENRITLAEVAWSIGSREAGGESARSYGSNSISVNPTTDPWWGDSGGDGQGFDDDLGYWDSLPDGYQEPDRGDGSDGSNGSDDGSGGGGGRRGGSPCEPDPFWRGWDGDVYCGEVDGTVRETLEGYGESERHRTFCITMGFDKEGVPGRIPVPVFARGEWLDVDVRFANETAVYTVWVYEVTVTVVSATYTTTTADVVLDLDVSFIGEHSAITAQGVHKLQTEVVGDSLSYASQTHYDGHFRAGDESDPDWEADATQDYDCSGTLARQ